MNERTADAVDQDRRRGTAIGSIAIGLWATLALGAASTGGIPPFLMTAITFGVAGFAGALIARILRRDLSPIWRQPRRAWALGLIGFFGYHVCYFLAFRLSPSATVEVNLINYLWPLFIVLFSAIGPGRGLGRAQFAGAAAGLIGCFLIVAGRGGGASFSLSDLPGYLSALSCAVLWAAYSVGANRFCAHVPTEAVIGQCWATSLLAALCHLLFEPATAPSLTQSAVAALMGFGPMGAAFYVWDYGVKKGDVQTLGALCYAGPLLSTLLLIVTGTGQGGAHVWTAAAFIIGGAILASRDMFRKNA